VRFWEQLRSPLRWLYVASVSRHFILGRKAESRGTLAGFYPPIWVGCAALTLLLPWVAGGFRRYTTTDTQIWLVAIAATLATVLLTRGIGQDRGVILGAQQLDAGTGAQRNALRAKVWVFYLALGLAIYVMLTKAVYVPQLQPEPFPHVSG
jgi:hypothetical protein